MVQACQELGVTLVPFSPLVRVMFAERFPNPNAFEDMIFERILTLPGTKFFCQPQTDCQVQGVCFFPRLEHIKCCFGLGSRSGRTFDSNSRYSNCWASFGMGSSRGNSVYGEDRDEIKRLLPVGFAHGDRYSDAQVVGIERYC